jgi:hypothetical protein
VATQRLDTHARIATAVTQLPPGTGCPFATFGWHAPASARLLHQFPAPHSASVKHVVPHAPEVVLQFGVAAGHGLVAPEPLSPLQGAHTAALEHTGCGLVQSAEVAHPTHVPAPASTPASASTQTPAPAVGHECVAVDPKLPLQGAHRLLVGSQTGSPAGQSVARTQPPHVLAAITACVHGVPA